MDGLFAPTTKEELGQYHDREEVIVGRTLKAVGELPEKTTFNLTVLEGFIETLKKGELPE